MGKDMRDGCSCVIAAYNEGERVLAVIESLLHVPSLTSIICVDDGSRDNTAEEIKKRFKTVTVIKNPKNVGKSESIKNGVDIVKTPYVFLIDADLSNIIPSEIDFAVTSMKNDSSIDMLVFRRLNDPWFSRLIRGEILSTGERVMKTEDLQAILSSHPHGYQLEFAINKYMMEYKKNVFWVPFSGRNFPKIFKRGIVSGVIKELTMYKSMIDYAGAAFVLKSFFTFCHREYKKR